jgi:putative ABC transport system permease protein
MIRNYLKIAVRKALKDRTYSLINIFGLAVGLASFLFISSYVDFERKVDLFHKNYNTIYRVHTDLKWNEVDESFPQTAPAVGTAIKENFGEVEYVTRIRPYMAELLVKIEDEVFHENGIMAVDSNFLKVFSFNLLEGNPHKIFDEPAQAVLSRSYAQKYFGEEKAINKLVDIDGLTYKVAGIIEDARADSHIQYNILVSNLSDKQIKYFEWSWIWCNLVTYVRLNPQVSPEVLESKFPDLVKNNAGYAIERITGKPLDAFFARGNHLGYLLEPLSEVYYSGYNPLGSSGSKTFIYIFGVVAITILLLACINYTNLTTARSMKRAREIGLRKVVGTTRRQLHLQFLTESTLFSLASMVIAIFMYEVINNFMANSFDIRWDLSLLNNIRSLWYIAAMALTVGVFSGLYPAIYLSSFNPSRALKGALQRGQTKSPMRNMLLIFQFLISFCIIIFTFTVNSQIKFLRNRDLGFDKENLLVIRNINYLPGMKVFKNEINRNASVISSTLSASIPSGSGHGELFRKMHGEQQDYLFNLIDADQDFVKTFGLKLNAGQNFTANDMTSRSPKIVVNEKAKSILEYKDAIGENIMGLDDSRVLVISGVIDDFDYSLAQSEVPPIVIRPFFEEQPNDVINYLTVKIASHDLPGTISEFEKIWNDQRTGLPFQYQFYDQIFNDMYLKEIRLGNLLTVFSGLAIIIAILGLIGLISYHTEQLTKSIGVRKVFGATVINILGLITRDFAKLFIVAFVIAVPLANYAIKDWLEAFVNKINIDLWIFIIPGTGVITIALLTIWIQSFKSASANPVDAIRNE